MVWRKARNGNKCECCQSSSSSSSSSSGSGSSQSHSDSSSTGSDSVSVSVSGSSSASDSGSESVETGSCCGINPAYVQQEYRDESESEVEDWLRSQEQGRENVGFIFHGPVYLEDTDEFYGALICLGQENDQGKCDCQEMKTGLAFVCIDGVTPEQCGNTSDALMVPGTQSYTPDGECSTQDGDVSEYNGCDGLIDPCELGCPQCIGICCFEVGDEQDGEYRFDSISDAVSFAEGQELAYQIYYPGQGNGAEQPTDVMVETALWAVGPRCDERTEEECPEGLIVKTYDNPVDGLGVYQSGFERGIRFFDPEDNPDLTCADDPCGPCPCPRQDLVSGQFVIDFGQGVIIFRGCNGCENAPEDGSVSPLPGGEGDLSDLVSGWVGGDYFAYCAGPVQDLGGGVIIYNFTVSDEPPCNPISRHEGEALVETRSLPAGPGTELKKLLKFLGLPDRPGCSCNKKAQLMDKWGWQVCSIPEKEDEIISWLKQEAVKRKLPFVEWGARVIVRRAVRNARKAK